MTDGLSLELSDSPILQKPLEERLVDSLTTRQWFASPGRYRALPPDDYLAYLGPTISLRLFRENTPSATLQVWYHENHGDVTLAYTLNGEKIDDAYAVVRDSVRAKESDLTKSMRVSALVDLRKYLAEEMRDAPRST